MKLEVNQDTCIGCGACQAICPEVFEINDDGLATTIVDTIEEDVQDAAIDAKEGCPVNAIEEVDEIADEEVFEEAA